MFKGFGDGSLGRDAELRFTPNGNANLQWSMAFNTGFGENKATTWVRCTLWGKRAESLVQYLTKGVRIAVAGTLENREYQDKDGNTRTSLDMNVDEISFLSPKGENSAANTPAPTVEEDSDDVPF